jgi:hypothetical protein
MGFAANKLIPLHWFGHSHSTLMDVYILNLRFARKKKDYVLQVVLFRAKIKKMSK